MLGSNGLPTGNDIWRIEWSRDWKSRLKMAAWRRLRYTSAFSSYKVNLIWSGNPFCFHIYLSLASDDLSVVTSVWVSVVVKRRGWETLESVEPRRLSVMFRGQDASVEKDKNYDEPVERLWLDGLTTLLAHPAIQLRQTSPNNRPPTTSRNTHSQRDTRRASLTPRLLHFGRK